jgi:hypothetical protein
MQMESDEAARELPAAEEEDAGGPSSAASSSSFDPGAAVHQEVVRGVESMVEQHTSWLELLAAGQRGAEYDWRTAELLSCLRSIEWDLQDLEDHLSIVEGNRTKFASLDDDFIAARKELIVRCGRPQGKNRSPAAVMWPAVSSD